MQVATNGIALECEIHGPEDGQPLILIRGLGTQLAHWSEELIQSFSACGYRVIVFDNRDVGLSDRCPANGVDASAEAIVRDLEDDREPSPAYRLSDLADDVVGLLDALDIPKAHVFGISMGGAITQLLIRDHPDRFISATIVMSVGRRIPTAARAALVARPQSHSEFLQSCVREEKNWGSPGWPMADVQIQTMAERVWSRGVDAQGYNRQLLAVIAEGDRLASLAQVSIPTLVIHGDADTLIPWQAGQEIAEAIPGAKFELIRGMGHNIPPALSPRICEIVDEFIRNIGSGDAP